MFGIEHYSSFVVAIISFQLLPGPGTLRILNATARYGVRSGMSAVWGTLTGDFLFMLGAVLGLAALLAAHPAILSSLQWLGIAYLCWLGLRLLDKPSEKEETEPAQSVERRRCSRRALAVCMTNPKAIMFFMAFFPLFLAPTGDVLTLLVMMAHVSLISLFYQTMLVLAGNAVAVRFSRFPCVRVWARRLTGLGLIAFGIKLAVRKR